MRWAQPAEGSIVLNDGTTSKGLVSYSHLTGIVDFESFGGDVRQSQSARYNARNIAGFALQGKTVLFYSFRSPTGVVKQFFGVVRGIRTLQLSVKQTCFRKGPSPK